MAFLGNLVSAQTVFLRPCLSMIASHFVPPRVIIKDGGVDVSDSDDEDDNLPANFDTCHRALQIITRYVPSTPWFLMPILVDKFPFVRKSERTLECYVHNLLKISVYFPTLRREILELVIEKLLKLDVSVSRQDIEDAEEAAAQSCAGTDTTEGLFSMDEDEDTEPGKKADLDRPSQMAHPIAERLDILLSLLLSYIEDVCHVDALNWDLQKHFWNISGKSCRIQITPPSSDKLLRITLGAFWQELNSFLLSL